MSKKVYDLAVKTGTYQDAQGNTKGRWLNVGAVMEGDDGGQFAMLHRTFNPAGVPDLNGKGSDSVLVSMFEPKQRDGRNPSPSPQPQPQASGGNGGGAIDDDVPFAPVDGRVW